MAAGGFSILWLRNVLGPLLPGSQQGLARLQSLPSCPGQSLPLRPWHFSNFHTAPTSNLPFLAPKPCPLPQLCFAAVQPCLLSAFHGVKHIKLTTWHFFLLLCNLKLNMDLGLPWLVLELPLSYFGTASHQCSRLPCV